jgi:hypothetical protein
VKIFKCILQSIQNFVHIFLEHTKMDLFVFAAFDFHIILEDSRFSYKYKIIVKHKVNSKYCVTQTWKHAIFNPLLSLLFSLENIPTDIV